MVQIRRGGGSRQALLRRTRRSLMGLLRFVCFSAVVPLLFIVRFHLFNWNIGARSREATQPEPEFSSNGGAIIAWTDLPPWQVLRGWHDRAASSPSHHHSPWIDLNNWWWADLSYCAPPANATHFVSWATPILNETMTAWQQRRRGVIGTNDEEELARDQIVTELAELYSQLYGQCDYGQFHPTVPENALSRDMSRKLQAWMKQNKGAPPPAEEARLIVSIIVHQDVVHLRRLLVALWRPQHLIALHVEYMAPPAIVTQVQQLAESFDNVIVLQFGSILYTTDAVSMTQYRLMRFLHDAQYDYWMSIGSAVYPLFSAAALARHLRALSPSRQVWLGELLTTNGETVREPQHQVLLQKRLVIVDAIRAVTAVNAKNTDPENYDDPTLYKFARRLLPRSRFTEPAAARLHPDIARHMQYKTNSGNQAVYRRDVVQQLLDSPVVNELLAWSKYACCCCVEEHNWMAALRMVGVDAQHALEQAGVFQVWGGEDENCGSSMKNAYLSFNQSRCFSVPDATVPQRPINAALYMRGDETMQYLHAAKARGVLLARKFASDHAESMNVLERIEAELWDQQENDVFQVANEKGDDNVGDQDGGAPEDQAEDGAEESSGERRLANRNIDWSRTI